MSSTLAGALLLWLSAIVAHAGAGPAVPDSGPAVPDSGPAAPDSGPAAPDSGPAAPDSGPVGILRLDLPGSRVLALHVGRRGADAWRVGRLARSSDAGPRTAGRAVAWRLPKGDAVLIEGSWWSPLVRLDPVTPRRPGRALRAAIRARIAPADDGSGRDRLYQAALGDVTGDGRVDLVLAYRRPFRRTYINATRPVQAWRDAAGMSAHLGIFEPSTLRERWVAGTILLPVVRIAVCDASLAVAYGTLDQPGTVATGAWRWQGFGFLTSEPLRGGGSPACVDLDGDGRSEPAVLGRSRT